MRETRVRNLYVGRRLPIVFALAALLLLAASASALARTATVTIVPAAGPPGTTVTVIGSGFPARRLARIKLTGAAASKLRVSRSGAFVTHLTVPSSALGNLNLVSRTKGRRVLNRFAIATGTGAVSEISTSRGQRLRWTVGASAISLQGRGFKKRARLKVRWLGRTLTLRTNRRGRFLTSLTLPTSGSSHPALVRIGSLRLRFLVAGAFGSGSPVGGAGIPGPSPGGGTSSPPPAPVVTPPPPGAPPTPPENTVTPTITGMAVVGQTLTSDPGAWTGTLPINFSFRWRRCNGVGTSCSNISGATGQSYTLKTADGGHTLRVVVTATNSVDTSAATSSPSALVPGPPPPPPPSGEVAHWSMDSTGTMVDSAGNHDGTTHNVTLDPSGSSGAAYKFTGASSYASVSSSTASDLDPGTQDFTVTIHMKPTALPNSGDEDADIIRKGVYANSPASSRWSTTPAAGCSAASRATGPRAMPSSAGIRPGARSPATPSCR